MFQLTWRVEWPMDPKAPDALASKVASKWFGGDFGLGMGLGPPTSAHDSSLAVVVVMLIGVWMTGSVWILALRTARVCKCL
jgi:hypothetical protein